MPVFVLATASGPIVHVDNIGQPGWVAKWSPLLVSMVAIAIAVGNAVLDSRRRAEDRRHAAAVEEQRRTADSQDEQLRQARRVVGIADRASRAQRWGVSGRSESFQCCPTVMNGSDYAIAEVTLHGANSSSRSRYAPDGWTRWRSRRGVDFPLAGVIPPGEEVSWMSTWVIEAENVAPQETDTLSLYEVAGMRYFISWRDIHGTIWYRRGIDDPVQVDDPYAAALKEAPRLSVALPGD